MVQIPISIGELLDKLSILQIKKNEISDESKLKIIEKEFILLKEISIKYLLDSNIENLYNDLISVNSKLWKIEDELRKLEIESKFDENFIKLARLVYYTNDERYELKNRINTELSSEINEIKDYVNYKQLNSIK
jgi:hypothetical protein